MKMVNVLVDDTPEGRPLFKGDPNATVVHHQVPESAYLAIRRKAMLDVLELIKIEAAKTDITSAYVLPFCGRIGYKIQRGDFGK